MPPMPPMPPMPDVNEIFLNALTPVVDIFWSIVWSAASSSIQPPPISI